MNINDKILHFAICAIMTTVLASWVLPFPVALLFPILIAVGKEVDDLERYGHFCWYDIIADVLGIVVGSLISIFVTGVCNWGF